MIRKISLLLLPISILGCTNLETETVYQESGTDICYTQKVYKQGTSQSTFKDQQNCLFSGQKEIVHGTSELVLIDGVSRVVSNEVSEVSVEVDTSVLGVSRITSIDETTLFERSEVISGKIYNRIEEKCYDIYIKDNTIKKEKETDC